MASMRRHWWDNLGQGGSGGGWGPPPQPDPSPVSSDDLRGMFLARLKPFLLRALQRYGESATPEGRARMAAAFRQRALAGARSQAAAQGAALNQQGYGQGYASGLSVNAFNQAQKAANDYAARANDPAKELQDLVGTFKAFDVHDQPLPSSGGSLLGDLGGIAGIIGGFLGPTKAGAKPQPGGGTSSFTVPGSMDYSHPFGKAPDFGLGYDFNGGPDPSYTKLLDYQPGRFGF